MIHLYAFTGTTVATPEVAGVDESEVELRRFGSVTAVVSVVGAPADPTRDALRHGLVVEALLECADCVLPVRFGETFADERALAAALEPCLDTLEQRLARVGGCVEIAVRVLLDRDDDVATAADGAGYMRAKLAAVVHGEAALATLHRALSEHAQGSIGPTASARTRGHDAAYLVRRAAVADFAGAADRYAETHPEVALLCTGPWAPYSFAGAA